MCMCWHSQLFAFCFPYIEILCQNNDTNILYEVCKFVLISIMYVLLFQMVYEYLS